MTAPIVFVHGAFCGGWAFEAFRQPFEAAGYVTHAPNLPDHEHGADLARLAAHGVKDYANALVGYCRPLPEAPILVGHSLGGLVCQIAATKMKPAALVLLAPSAPWGVAPTTLDEHQSNFGLTLLGDYWRRPISPDFSVAKHSTLDRLDHAAARQAYARFVPESGRAVLEAVQWWLDPAMNSAAPAYKIEAPLLALAGGKDRVNPASTIRRLVKRFPEGQASFAEFEPMSHWLVGEPEWPQVAQTAIDWLSAQSLAPAKPKKKFALFGARA